MGDMISIVDPTSLQSAHEQAARAVRVIVVSTSGGTAPVGSVAVTSVTAGRLRKDRVTRTAITCTNANTDYAAGAVIPSWATAIIVSGPNAFVVQVDEATSASIGAMVPATTPTMFPVAFGASGGDSTVHVQSATAGTVVDVSYLAD